MLSALLLALSSAPASPEPILLEPDIHGDQIVFSSEGDLWLGSLTEGRAARLTRDEGGEMDARFSPDGTQIAFTAEYEGTREVYVMPTSGGAPVRVTFTGVVGESLGWTSDGRNILYRTVGPPNNVVFRLVPATGGPSQALPLEFAAYGSFAPDGRLAFTRYARYTEPWFGYKGGLKNDIWLSDPGFKSFRRIYAATGTSECPVWANGRICFVQDDGGQFSIVSVRPDGKDAKRIAGPYPLELRELASDGKRVIYERGTSLEVADPSTGEVKPVSVTLTSDLIHTRTFRVPVQGFIDEFSPAPDGKRAVAESRGQIVSLPVDGRGEARVSLAKEGVRYRHPELSPDGKRIAFVGDESGEQQIYVAEADGSSPRQLTNGAGRQLNRIRWTPNGKSLLFTDSDTHLCLVPASGGAPTTIARGTGRDGPDFDVSPDSKWVVYAFTNLSNSMSSVYLYSLENGSTTRISGGMSNDFSPAFTKDGKAIAFLSERSFNPSGDALTSNIDFQNATKPYLILLRNDSPSPFAPEDAEDSSPPAPQGFRVDLPGISDRVVEVPCPSGNFSGLEATATALVWINSQPDGRWLEGYDLKAKRHWRMGNADYFRLSMNGKSMLVASGSRGQIVPSELHVYTADEGLISNGNLQLRIDPVAEWRQMYWEGWRYIRDYFYVPNMHGLDWRKIGEKYAAYLPRLRSRSELDRLFRYLLGELNVSHARTTPGASRILRRTSSPAFLGIDLATEPGGAVRIKRILRGDGINLAERSPLAEPGLGVHEGDYLLEVAGEPVRGDQSVEEPLVGRAGQSVSLLISDRPTKEGAKRILVRPLASEFRLRYLDWVRGRREQVERLSGGKVGYVHLLSMTPPDMADFLRQYLPQRNRQALLVDVRYNTGGYISSRVINFLKQRLVASFNMRSNEGFTTRQVEFFDGPMACLINEFSRSNGEEFPHQFRAEGLGKLIGKRTWGGEVGSDPGWPLVDGGKIYVPNYGAWTDKDGWIIEGHGIDPDVEVENNPAEFAQGRDEQLERGVKELLDALAKRPPVKRATPPPPIRRGGG